MGRFLTQQVVGSGGGRIIIAHKELTQIVEQYKQTVETVELQAIVE